MRRLLYLHIDRHSPAALLNTLIALLPGMDGIASLERQHDRSVEGSFRPCQALDGSLVCRAIAQSPKREITASSRGSAVNTPNSRMQPVWNRLQQMLKHLYMITNCRPGRSLIASLHQHFALASTGSLCFVGQRLDPLSISLVYNG